MKTHICSLSSIVALAAPIKVAFVMLLAVPGVCTAQSELPAPVAKPATFVTATTFTANWTSVPGASSYFVDVNTDSTFSLMAPSYAVLGTGVTFSASPSTTYYYRVVATSGGIGTSSSPYSNITAVTTAAQQPAPPDITNPSTCSAIAGASFNLQITAINAPATYAATGLPAGLAIDTDTGLITGTPTAPVGAYTATITATNVAGSTTRQLTITLLADNTLTYEPNITLVTLAGAAGVAGSTNATGTSARFNAPAGAVTDLAGNLYIADTNNNTIRRIALNGQATTLPITGLSAPTALATTPDGATLYIADTGNNAIRSVNLATNQTTTLATTGLNAPAGLAVDPDGNLYIANTGAHTIVQIEAGTGTQYTIAGAPGISGSADTNGYTIPNPARFNLPTGLAISPEGDFLYIADTGNSTIRALRIAASKDTYPVYPAVEEGHYRLILTMSNLAANITGRIDTLAGAPLQPGAIDGTPADARLNTPQALATDAAGNLYIADTGNHLIRKIAVPGGNIITIAGVPGTPGANDGSGAQARLNLPAAITTDPLTGDIYIADTANHTIRVLQARPSVLAQAPSRTVNAGASANFSAVMSGAPAPDYQWYLGAKAIVGATTAIYNIAAASAADAGTYTLTGTNIMGSVTTAPMTLTVTSTSTTPPPPADGTNNGNNSGGGGGGAPSHYYLSALVFIVFIAALRRALRVHCG